MRKNPRSTSLAVEFNPDPSRRQVNFVVASSYSEQITVTIYIVPLFGTEFLRSIRSVYAALFTYPRRRNGSPTLFTPEPTHS